MYRLGIDIGGTFTDLVLVNVETGSRLLGKILTTPDNPSEGAIKGVRRLLDDTGIDAQALRHVIHGTTLVINALIEQKGARTGLLTTRGFRDILEMRRGKRFDIDDLFIEVPAPLVPRSRVGEIAERMDFTGRAVIELDDRDAEAAVDRMVAQGVEAIAVSFLHAYRNGVHEERVREMIRARAPDVAVSLSSEVSPDIREYERTSTTVANAYTQPIMQRYLSRMAEDLSQLGYGHDLYLMLSDAGLTTVETAAAFPIRLMESGPAGGATTARYYSDLLGRPNLVAFDMGGTTAKIMFISDGEIMTADELETARRYRFKRGSGIPIRIPVVEMLEIGSGGGGIAALNEMGLLKVGPHSAGAQPGPACYGRGGTAPTVTDANLLLGYLNPDYFLGGRMRLDAEAAAAAVTPVAQASGLTEERVAWGIHEIVTEDMAQAAQLHLLERGVDPRKFALLAFGGAGPLHACGLARKLGISEVIIPYAAGVASAFGFLAAPLSITLVQGHPVALNGADCAAINALLDRLEKKGRDFLRKAGVAETDMRLRRFASLRYRGQSSEMKIPVPDAPLDDRAMSELAKAFSDSFERVYGRANHRVGVEALNWQIQAIGPKPSLTTAPAVARASTPAVGERLAYFAGGGGWVATPAIPRSTLLPGTQLRGPLLIEEDESTTVIPPETTLTIDDHFNLIIKLEPMKK